MVKANPSYRSDQSPIQLHWIEMDDPNPSASDETEIVSQDSPEEEIPDRLPPDEEALLTAYRKLPSVPRLAIRRFVLTGDRRLVEALYNRIFLGLKRR